MNRRFYLLIVAFALPFFIFVSCDLKDDDGQVPVTTNTYLVNYTQVNSAPLNLIKIAFEQIEKESPVPISLSAKAKYGVWVYKMSYKTTFKNKEVVASGVVCVPMTDSSEQFPILSFQNGTNTLNSKAPSNNINDEYFILIQSIASLGYIVVIPDYLGFGTSSNMFHPYLDKESTVKSIIDMYGAVKEMCSSKYLDINMSKDLYLMGYSQGAWASMALTHEIETKYANNFNLKGTAAGGGVYDLTTLIDYIMGQNTYPMPVYLGYIFHSYIQKGSVSFTYQDVFNAPFAASIPGLYNGQRDGAFINSQLSTDIKTLFANEFRTNYKTAEKYASLRAALKANSVEPWKTNVRIFMRHGAADTYVPPFQSLNMYEGFVARNVAEGLINYGTIPMQNHNDAVFPFGIFALNWLLSLN